MNTQQVKLSPLYSNRIKKLHENKIEINDAKIKHFGYINIDDHGFIYYPDFNFEVKYSHPAKVLVGAREIGENLRLLLNESPKYINNSSALAGCWTGIFNANRGYTPENTATHLQDIIEKYKITQPGNGAIIPITRCYSLQSSNGSTLCY